MHTLCRLEHLVTMLLSSLSGGCRWIRTPERWFLVSIYAPYLIIPVMLLLTMLKYCTYFL
uniref:Uncharacterized protein n=1 Tax=Sphaeramia orbicularis TaxID=375764 RepID=A0A672Y8Y6_9TELE